MYGWAWYCNTVFYKTIVYLGGEGGGGGTYINETWEIKNPKETQTLSLWASADCHSHSCYLWCNGFVLAFVISSLSLLIWPALSLLLSENSLLPTALTVKGREADEGGEDWPGTSCSPRNGCTVFLCLHPECGYAGGLAVWIHIEIIAIDSPTHCRTTKKTAHVCLSHVTAARIGNTEEVGHRSVRMRRHAGRDRVARHNTSWHRRRCTAAADPRRVLDLREDINKHNVKIKTINHF